MKKILLGITGTLCSFIVQAQQVDSLDFKIGQMIMIGMAKAEFDPEVAKAIQQGKAGAILLFEKNIPKTNSYANLKKTLYSYQKIAPVPLFICIDQEGGRVNRLKEKYGFPRSITAAAMGKAKTLDSVRFYASSTATTLAGLGFNVNFAPVVDLAVNPLNPIIAKVERAFSNNEDTVVMMAEAFVQEHRKVGVLTTLKHFPGHGSSKDDTHLGVADVTKTWTDRELIPYQKMINDGYVDAVMSSHIVNKKLDKDSLPGTLSKDVLDGILRKKLGFNGVVFSDDMQMQAITKNYGFEESIKLAINAGIDILCFSNNIAGSEDRTVDKVHDIIRKYVERGAISRERINQSYVRIVKLKQRLNSNAGEAFAKELAAANQKITSLQQKTNQSKTT
ncbi:MAG TPA: glycoside hydrolase family 3 N-terminal domain-containing protein, partial [Cyclobacteriaceae bacterium]|nr:glycoside hydrolase family 3 N-terminal domain-containing protein [Cyclobacteriaceae bacterium]